MRRFVTGLPALIVLLTTTLVLVAAPAVLDRLAAAHASARITLARQTLTDDDVLTRIDRALVALADSSIPGVVHLSVAQNDFGRSSGSGWVFDRNGYIVTNAHVVRGSDRIRVQFADGRTARGTLIGTDAFTDIAVIKIDTFPGLFPLPRSEDEIVRQGQRVYAFGSPFGFKFSMSEGIVSGLGRDPSNASEFGGFTNFIQTDAAVNPGNSGGPLMNSRGELVGMNVAIATGRDTDGTTEGDSAGISFAIPVATIESVVPQLIRTGRVSRGYLGLSFVNRPASEETERGRFVAGIRVGSVVPEGPSARAGLREEDLVVRVAGQRVPEFNLLRSIVGGAEPGTVVPIEVFRDGETLEVEVTLGEMPDFVLAQSASRAIMLRLGAMVSREDGAERQDARPVVENVFPGGPAAMAGLVPGDTVIEVEGRRTETLDRLMVELTAAGALDGADIDMTVERDGVRVDVQLDLR
ncbi:MAG: trypsin-like peptidase domain-containing protein [Planctomycetota bacterium]